MARCIFLLLTLACTGASFVHPQGLRGAMMPRASSRSAPHMVASDVLGSAVAPGLPSAALVADVFDGLSSIADSPLILLVPIGGGTLVAMVIIYILVKSAG